METFRKIECSTIDPHDPVFDRPLSDRVTALVDKDGNIVDYFDNVI